MKVLLLVACFTFAYAASSPVNKECAGKDLCTQGYDTCVTRLGGSKWAHYLCGGSFLVCKKACFLGAKFEYYKCMVFKKDESACKKEAEDYAKKNCPQPSPCVVKCKKAAIACYKKTHNKKQCRKELIACVKKCCHPSLQQDEMKKFEF